MSQLGICADLAQTVSQVSQASLLWPGLKHRYLLTGSQWGRGEFSLKLLSFWNNTGYGVRADMEGGKMGETWRFEKGKMAWPQGQFEMILCIYHPSLHKYNQAPSCDRLPSRWWGDSRWQTSGSLSVYRQSIKPWENMSGKGLQISLKTREWLHYSGSLATSLEGDDEVGIRVIYSIEHGIYWESLQEYFLMSS